MAHVRQIPTTDGNFNTLVPGIYSTLKLSIIIINNRLRMPIISTAAVHTKIPGIYSGVPGMYEVPEYMYQVYYTTTRYIPVPTININSYY